MSSISRAYFPGMPLPLRAPSRSAWKHPFRYTFTGRSRICADAKDCFRTRSCLRTSRSLWCLDAAGHLNFDAHRVVHFQQEIARILQAPIVIGNIKIHSALPLIGIEFRAYAGGQLMFAAMQHANAVKLRARAALWLDGTSTRSGRNTMSVKRAFSSTSLCILLSRESLPLWPLIASTTISPAALPVAGS